MSDSAARVPRQSSWIKVVLVCQDQISVRNPPLSPKVKYACTAGQGHGYNLAWLSYTDRGVVSYNPEYTVETDGPSS